MSTIFSDSDEMTSISTPASQNNAQPAGLMSGLPSSYILRSFSSLRKLRIDAQQVLDELDANDDGNQYILLLNIPKAVRIQLDEDRNALDGVGFRFMFEGSAGLIKVVPSYAHDAITGRLSFSIDRLCIRANVPDTELEWALTTTFRPTVGTRGKKPDNCLLPRSRQGSGGQQQGWPTLVIESGVSESFSKLHDDAKWWFENSGGQVRYVIILCIKRARRTILLQKLQLSCPGQPASAAMAGSIQQMVVPPMPPLVPQTAVNQHPFVAQAVTITPTTVVGSNPIYLHFQALFDRAPQPSQGDIVLDSQRLLYLAENL